MREPTVLQREKCLSNRGFAQTFCARITKSVKHTTDNNIVKTGEISIMICETQYAQNVAVSSHPHAGTDTSVRFHVLRLRGFISSPCGDGYRVGSLLLSAELWFHLIPMRGRIRIETGIFAVDDGFISSPCGDGYRQPLIHFASRNSFISSPCWDGYSSIAQKVSKSIFVSSHPHAGTDTGTAHEPCHWER